jgi:hypothetical protein
LDPQPKRARRRLELGARGGRTPDIGRIDQRGDARGRPSTIEESMLKTLAVYVVADDLASVVDVPIGSK